MDTRPAGKRTGLPLRAQTRSWRPRTSSQVDCRQLRAIGETILGRETALHQLAIVQLCPRRLPGPSPTPGTDAKV